MKTIINSIKAGCISVFAHALLFQNMYGQVTFNSTIDFNGGDESAQSIVVLSDGYMLIGGGWGYELGDYFDEKLKFTKIDLNGNVIWQNYFGDSAVNYFCEGQAGIITQDGNVLFSGSRQTPVESEMYLLKIDPATGDTVFFKRYHFDDHIYGLEVKEFSSGELLYSGWDSNDDYGFQFLKLKENGDTIWVKRYGTNNELNPTNFSIGANDTIFVINSDSPALPAGYHYRTIDSVGEVFSSSIFHSDYLFYGLKAQDGGLYGPGGYFPVPPFQSYVYKTDNSGEVIWRYESQVLFDTLLNGELYPGLAKELPNGDFIIMGYYASNNAANYVGIVSKVNSEGIPYWERYYTATPDHYSDRINDLALTADGGFIAAGAGFSEEVAEDQNFWVLKLDSMGCLVPGCDSMDIGIMELSFSNELLTVFPNPVHQNAIIEFTGNSAIDPSDLKMIVADISGKVIYMENISAMNTSGNAMSLRFGFDRKNIPNGVYMISILSNGTSIASTKILFD